MRKSPSPKSEVLVDARSAKGSGGRRAAGRFAGAGLVPALTEQEAQMASTRDASSHSPLGEV